ncbi:WD40 repeat-like protein [Mycena sp. CBHHK59/15]|nr:WD40 repeat-like protein [Mycena sp. CBHHK59/15]
MPGCLTFIPKLHPYANVAWKVLTSVYQVVIKQQETDDKLLKLIQTMVEVYSFVEDTESVSQKIKRLEETVLAIVKQTAECAIFIQEYTGTGFSARSLWSDSSKKIDELSDSLRKLKEALDSSMSIQSIFISAKILDQVENLVQLETLKSLNPVDMDGSLRGVCLPGTRQDILASIIEWLTMPSDNSNLLWLHSVAGAGKSTISTTVAEHCRSLHRLGAFLHFDRNNPTGSSPTSVIRTIAYWLAYSNPHIRSAICDALAQEPTVIMAPIQTQFKKLLLEPLSATQNHIRGPIIVILDALDECGDAQSRAALVFLLSNEVPKLPAVFRFFITSRPDSDIASRFCSQSKITQLPLDITTPSSKADVMSYLCHRMHSIQEEQRDWNLGSDWPGISKIQILADYSAGLFIWASTACRFINSYNPDDKLEVLIGHGHNLISNLDELYAVALQNSGDWDHDKGFSEDAQAVLAALVLGRVPMSDKTMDDILQFGKKRSSQLILGRLGCVLQWSPGENAHILHASFGDYLTDSSRSGLCPWFVNKTVHNYALSLGCLQILNTQLQFNICGLEDSHCCNVDVPDLSDRVTKSISPGLAYSSCFWAAHLIGIDFNPVICRKIKDLMQAKFPFWLEVLSLLGEVAVATNALKSTGKYLEGHDKSLVDLIADAKKFVAAFAPVISQSVPHIYLSALPLSPRVSSLAQQYHASFPQTLHFHGPLGDIWPRIQAILQGHSGSISSVAFSPDGTQIVSGSEDCTVRLWDAQTGHTVAGPIKGHHKGVLSVGFSPDGTQIVSGSEDCTVRVWDAQTGHTVAGPFEGHSKGVLSVGFSPDGTQIVSGSDDHTVQVWDAQTGCNVAGPFEGHNNRVNSVAFSPDGTQIVSGSADCTVRMWGAQTGHTAAGPFEGHNDWVLSVAFSPNGTQIVSGSADCTVQVWDAQTGHIIAGPFEGHNDWVLSVSFSPNGTQIVSGSADCTVRVWNAQTGHTVAGPFEGHNNRVHSVAFSPDGTQIVSGSEDHTVRVWDAQTGHTVAGAFEGHSEGVNSVTFSPDDTQIVSGSDDRVVQVWDAQTGHTIAGPFEGHNNWVNSVAFSPDGTQIVSGSADHTVRVWDAQTGHTIVGPFEGHNSWVRSVAFSPDGTQIVSGSADHTVRVWDAQTGHTVAGPFEGHNDWVLSVAFSPDGTQIVSGSADHTVRVWDAQTGHTVAGPFEGHSSWVRSVVFSPNGTQIVSGSADHTVRVWDAQTGHIIVGPFEGHSGWVFSLALSPDGTQIVSGSADHTVRVWDAQTGHTVAGPFEGHNGWVFSVAFSPDGTQIVSGSADHTVRLWDTQTGCTVPAPFEGDYPIFKAGWIINPPSDLICWIPPWLHNGLYFPHNTLVIHRGGTTKLNFSTFVHGTEWQNCIDPRIRDAQ